MIDLGSEVRHEFVIACCVAEDYEKVLEGPDAVEEEAMRTHAKCRRFRFFIRLVSAISAATAA